MDDLQTVLQVSGGFIMPLNEQEQTVEFIYGLSCNGRFNWSSLCNYKNDRANNLQRELLLFKWLDFEI